MTRKLRGENDEIKRLLEIFIIESENGFSRNERCRIHATD